MEAVSAGGGRGAVPTGKGREPGPAGGVRGAEAAAGGWAVEPVSAGGGRGAAATGEEE